MRVEQSVGGDGQTTLQVHGDLDIATCSDLREAAEARLEDSPAGIRLDLSSVTFIDSSGIGALVAIRNAANSAGAPLVMINPSEKVLTILDITRLTDIFTIETDGK